MKPEQINLRAWKLILKAVAMLRAQDVTLGQIGERCGTTRATVLRWTSGAEGGEKTPFVNMLRYLKGLDIPLETVLEGSYSMPPAISGLKVNQQDEDERYLSKKGLTVLGVYAVAGAGPAWESADSDPMFNIAVPARFLKPQISAILVSGSSMEPTILNSAVVGVNMAKTAITQGDIYAVRLPYEGIVVKRIYIDHGRKCFVLRSDNKKDESEFPDIFLPFEEDGENGFVYGKVSWVLQTYER